MKLGYWVGAIRQGRNKHGQRILYCHIAKSKKHKKDSVIVEFGIEDFNKDTDELAHIFAQKIVAKAKEMGWTGEEIPKPSHGDAEHRS